MDFQQIYQQAFTVTGIRMVAPCGSSIWDAIKSDGRKAQLEALSGQPCDLGLCFGFATDGSNDYMAGVEGASLNSFDCYEYPATTFLLFEVKGKISDGTLQNAWAEINQQDLSAAGYIRSHLPTLERYSVWDEASDQCQVDIMIPLQ
ncbi:GyrI-like domain-containing protein [Serratia aquatilis]|uniref:GyrI-like domain-containing protein n=1 Tax=Serratia aquatilis TaxID=1737515 RepID=A0ABV6EH13_9GAMM